MSMPDVKAKSHIGRKIERIREIRGIKQDTLANAIGVTQQAISKMEQSEIVDDDKLQKIADALGVTVDTIKNFNEDLMLNLIQNNSENSSHNYLVAHQYNPIEKVVELYERMLKEKDVIINEQKQLITELAKKSA